MNARIDDLLPLVRSMVILWRKILRDAMELVEEYGVANDLSLIPIIWPSWFWSEHCCILFHSLLALTTRILLSTISALVHCYCLMLHVYKMARFENSAIYSSLKRVIDIK